MHNNWDTRGFEFSLIEQRFFYSRWNTERGRRVLEAIVDGIKNNVEIRGILDPYVLQSHPENVEPYGYPIYPRDRLGDGEFWVLTQDDLRGAHFHNETFNKSNSLEVKSLDYCSFYNCQFVGANAERSALTRARFEQCDMRNVVLAAAGGYFTLYKNCDLRGACFWQAGLQGANLSGSDLSDAYFEDANLSELRVDYRTRVDSSIRTSWHSRSIEKEQLPDIYKAFRLAFSRAEIAQRADQYLYRERKAFRAAALIAGNGATGRARYLADLIWDLAMGYGVKPFRLLFVGPALVAIFALLFLGVGVPYAGSLTSPGILESIYFSLATFATIGFGDVHYGAEHPLMRLLSAFEGLTGAAWIAIFIAVLSRKVVR